MEGDDQALGPQEKGCAVTTVAKTVLSSFFDELAKTDELSETASCLRKAVLDDGVFAEAAIRAALFPDTP